MAREPRDPRSNRRQEPPPWQRQSPFLAEIAGLEAFEMLVPGTDPEAMNRAVHGWNQLDPDVKDWFKAKLQANCLLALDALFRQTLRNTALLESVRTGTRLTVEQLKMLNEAGFIDPEGGDYEDGDYEDYEDEGIPGEYEAEGPVVMEGNLPADPETAALAASFDALDASSTGVVDAAEAQQAQEAPPPKRKRAPAKKKRQRKAATSNGKGVQPDEIIIPDEPQQPQA